MGNHGHNTGKKKCVYCNRYFHPGEFRKHELTRKKTGFCPVKEPHGRLDNWTLEDCSEIT